jgi:elongation factor 1 alpha-like protein
MGRLLYDLKAVDEKTMQKYRQESQRAGKASFALAWVMDQSEEERKRSAIIFLKRPINAAQRSDY